MISKEKQIFIREVGFNLLSCGWYGQGAWRFAIDLYETQRWSSGLQFFFYGLMAFLSLVRRFPKSFTVNPFEWFVAFLGMVMSGAFGAAPSSFLQVPGVILQTGGLIITLAGLLALNRSYALVPANRGIKTGGLYRFVRHPLYLGYITTDFGIMINQFMPWNLLVFVFAVAMFVLRIQFEEAHLMQDPAYQQFTQKTRYRLLPGIW